MSIPYTRVCMCYEPGIVVFELQNNLIFVQPKKQGDQQTYYASLWFEQQNYSSLSIILTCTEKCD